MNHDDFNDINPADLMKDAQILWAGDEAKKHFGVEDMPNLLDIKSPFPRPISEYIDASIQILLETFGADVLGTLSGGTVELSQYAFGGFMGHPLGIIWRQLLGAKHLVLLGKLPIISKDLCLGFALSEYLDTIYRANNFDRIVRDLSNIKEPERFLKAFFEAHIAHGFISLGYVGTFLPESNTKTPDLDFQMDNRRIVVECKSLDTHRRDRGEIYHHLVKRIVQGADQRQKCYEIHIYPVRKINSSDIRPLTRFIMALLEENEEGIFYTPGGTTRILLRKLSDNYFKSFDELKVDFESEENSYLQAKVENIENGFFAPIYVGILEQQEKSILQAIETSFKKAKKQLKEYSERVRIVGIEIYSYSANELSAKLDLCDFFIRQKLKNNTYIHGVILSAFLFYRNDSEWPFQQYVSLIVNRDARNPIPDEKIYGFEPLLDLSEEKFSMVIFFLNESLKRNSEKLVGLASFCTKQMMTRTRFSLVDNSFFKLEFDSHHSKKLVYRNIFQVPENEVYSCAAAAFDGTKSEGSLAVNGKLSEFMYSSDDYPASHLIEAEKKRIFLTETRMIIEDAQYLGYQCQPYLFSTNQSYSFYCPDLENRKSKLRKILSSIEGLKKRAESIEGNGCIFKHKSLVIEYLENIRKLVNINAKVAEELSAIGNYKEYDNRSFWREATAYGQNVFVLLNKLIADERYYLVQLGPAFWY